MMPATRAVDDALPVNVVPPSACGSAPPRPAARSWWCLVILLTLASVAITTPAPVAAADFDPSENPWGFGYDGGLTLRRKLGDKWEIGITGGPNDRLSSGTDNEDREELPAPNTRSRVRTFDSRRESGFVAPHFGRTVWQKGTFDLLCYLRGKFVWENSSYHSDTVNESSTSIDRVERSSRQGDGRNWYLSLGFRPGYRPVPWFSIEVDFGLAYAWTNDTYREERVYFDEEGNSTRTVTNGENDGQTFSLFGYSGTSSFKFIVWF